jgi:hypothetical protein
VNQTLLKALIDADLELSRAYAAANSAGRPDVADEINEARQHLMTATTLVVASKGTP